MSTDVKFRFEKKENELRELPPDKIHNLPCRIDYNGKAEVSKYFDLYLNKSSESSEMTGTFRGHPLTAKITNVPEGYIGIFLKESRNKSRDGKEKIAMRSFKQLTYWNWSSSTPELDNLEETFKLLDYSSIIHGANS